MFLLYNIALYLLAPFILLYYAVRSLRRGKRLDGFRDRFGFSYGELRDRIAARPVLWVHAVSVGEVQVAKPLIQALRGRHPGHFILLTTVTPTGRTVLRQSLPEVDATRYFPLDFSSAVKRAILAVRPTLFVSLETEIWPNFTAVLRRMAIPSGIVNGRISPSSFRGYLRVRWFMGRVLKGFDFLAMQTPEDGDRIKALGAPEDRVEVMGNMKYDGSFLIPPDRVAPLQRAIGWNTGSLGSGKLLWVAGSTHRGEEETVLQAYESLISRFPELKLAVAPRHPERFTEVADLIEKHGLRYGRLSDSSNLPSGWKLLLVDTLGDLPAFYALATVVFVGGSFVPVGGHNVIEPAAWGKPVLFGPHMFNFKDVALKMLRSGCGIQVENARDLSFWVARWLESPEERNTLGKRALELVEENRGAVGRAVALIERHLSPSP